MKKLLLSFSVIFLFIWYSLHQKGEESNVQVVPSSFQSPTPSSTPFPTPESSAGIPPISKYKNGEYTGNVADAFYGNIQVKAIISNGQITDIQFLQYPSDRRTSIEINTQAMPYLKQEAIQTQSEQVDIVSGATDSSRAFIESLGSALAKAKS